MSKKNSEGENRSHQSTVKKRTSKNLPKWLFIPLWIILFVVRFVGIIFSTSWVGIIFPIFVVVPMRFLWDKNYSTIHVDAALRRIKHLRPNYKWRTTLSLIFFWISIITINANIDNMGYNNVATPTIDVLSQTGNI